MSTLLYLVILLIGGFLSYKNLIPKKVYPQIERIQLACLILMLFSMGLKMGMDDNVVSSFLTIGFHSILFGLATIISSILFVFISIKIADVFCKSCSKGKVDKEFLDTTADNSNSNIMSIILIGMVFIGLLLGLMIDSNLTEFTENLIQFGLYMLLFFTGIDIGKKNIFEEVKSIKLLFVLIPLSMIIGTLIGAYILGIILHYPANEATAVGAGFGWYSLSPIIISPYSDKLAALSFMSNVMREVSAIVLIPFVAKYIGYEEAIAPAGAAAMDTLLPIVSRNTNARTAVLSFTTGVILSTAVPILVPLCLYSPLR